MLNFGEVRVRKATNAEALLKKNAGLIKEMLREVEEKEKRRANAYVNEARLRGRRAIRALRRAGFEWRRIAEHFQISLETVLLVIRRPPRAKSVEIPCVSATLVQG